MADTPDIKALAQKALAGDPAAIRELRNRNMTGGGQPPEDEEDKPLPISSAQKRLWMLYQMDRSGIAYNMPGAFAIRGEIDTNAFEQVLKTLVRRHASLRTVFGISDGNPCGRIISENQLWPDGVILSQVDLSAGPDPEREAGRRLMEDTLAPFDLEKGPLLRIILFRLSPESGQAGPDYILGFNMHHIISDGWSVNILIREISVLYNAFAARNNLSLPALKASSRSIALWQQKRPDDPEMTAHRDYWLRKLGGDIPVLALHPDAPRPPFRTFAGATASFKISAPAARKLMEMSKAAGASLFMILTAALKTLLHRYSGQEDIIVGTPVAGRDHPDLDDQIGFFVNLIPLRDQVSPDNRFSDLLDRVKETAAEAYGHQAYPFDTLVDDLSLKRDISRSPLFDVLIVLQNRMDAPFSLTGLDICRHPRPFPVSRFDWTVYFEETDGGLNGEINYNSDLFNENRMQRTAAHLVRLIDSITQSPDARLRDLEIIPEAEHRLLAAFNDTSAPYPTDMTLIQLFEERLHSVAERPAVIFGDTLLTYEQLNRSANRIGGLLHDNMDAGGSPRIGVFLPRSHMRITALLGIFKAGGVYVPVDPTYPPERIRYIIEDSGCRAILTDAAGAKMLADISAGVKTVDITADGEKAAEKPPRRADDAGSPAYIIYTSGSTGRPKGVLLAHRGFANMILSQIDRLEVGSRDRVLQFASCSFDGSMYEIFMALLSGGALVCVEDTVIADPEALVKALETHKVTVAALPPAYLKAIGFEHLHMLKTLITAGERAIPDQGGFAKAGGAYWNLYGPTEISVTATSCRMPDKGVCDKTPPIGKPVANMRAYILNPAGTEIQPIGIPGEICLSGIGLALEYINQPEKTEKAFIPNPYEKNAHLYRTGDLGCWLPDGNIVFLGRIDDQVKIRGHRIEPGEIENRLSAHPQIGEAAVRAVSVAGDFELAAYVTGNPPPAETLKAFLRETLPGYMVPAFIIPVNHIPKTPNKKVDARALPHPDTIHTAGAALTPVGNETEAAVSGIWQEVLGRENIGIHDNFFDLGGNSIRIIRMRDKLREQVGADISVVDLFQHPTIHAIAGLISAPPAATVKTDEKRLSLRAKAGNRRRSRLNHRRGK